MIPIYLFCGFLDSGKSTLIRELLSAYDETGLRPLLIRTEFGDVPLPETEGLVCFDLPPADALSANSPKRLELAQLLREQDFSEIILEWNGMLSVKEAHLFLSELGAELRIRKIIFAGDEARLPALLAAPSSPLPGWLEQADLAVIRGASGNPGEAGKRRLFPGSSYSSFRAVRNRLKALRPDLKVLSAWETERIGNEVYGFTTPAAAKLFLPLLFVALLYGSSRLWNPFLQDWLEQTAFRSLSVFLQSLPYFLLGTALSSAIQILIPAGLFRRYFPQKLLPGLFFALIAGLFLPVCDCASVPVYRGLRKQGIPAAPALTFLLAAPVMNPVVWLSTLAAFPGQPRILLFRVGLGAAAALLTALAVTLLPGGGEMELQAAPPAFAGEEEYSSRAELFLSRCRRDFFTVGPWLLGGIIFSSMAQSLIRLLGWQPSFLSGPTGIAGMMGLAFLLSLCSSSDALVASSWFALASPPALLGFLLFGPMIDLKNLGLLRGSAAPRFILRLSVSCFLICFLLVFAFGGLL